MGSPASRPTMMTVFESISGFSLFLLVACASLALTRETFHESRETTFAPSRWIVEGVLRRGRLLLLVLRRGLGSRKHLEHGSQGCVDLLLSTGGARRDRLQEAEGRAHGDSVARRRDRHHGRKARIHGLFGRSHQAHGEEEGVHPDRKS